MRLSLLTNLEPLVIRSTILPHSEVIDRAVFSFIVFHKILDCVSDTAADEMRAAYKVGFKDGVAMMREIQE